MNFFSHLQIPYSPAICYSGFRDGQQPGGEIPSYGQVKEDLLLLQPHWSFLRLYDCDDHAAVVLEVIRKEGFRFQVMLGAYIVAEQNNPACPWGGGVYDENILQTNVLRNNNRIRKLIEWAQQYEDIVFALSVGNEACVDWTDHLVPVERVIAFVNQVKQQAKQPVTFCENYVPWLHHLQPLAAVVDFISIHTYPVWEYKTIYEALAYTHENFTAVANMYPNKPVVITEAGWATHSNGRGILPEHVNEENQRIYYQQLMEWAQQNQVLVFFFEAFDEQWKGSDHPLEPEKHWGLFTSRRTPKLALQTVSP